MWKSVMSRFSSSKSAVGYAFLCLIPLQVLSKIIDLPVSIGNWSVKASEILNFSVPTSNFYPPGSALLLSPFLWMAPNFKYIVFIYYFLSALIFFLIYLLAVSWYGYYIYRKKLGVETDSKSFFLAEGSLTWWAIGASLIASNISAEHFIGMSGSGFALGLAISTYEWMSAATLIIVAVFFIPVYLKNKIYTMPQFLSQRYNETVSLLMAIFWLLVYVFVNLTSIIYLGALAISSISGISFLWCIAGLAVFAILVTLGGMKVIG